METLIPFHFLFQPGIGSGVLLFKNDILIARGNIIQLAGGSFHLGVQADIV